jgi:Na+(H+)/acetate symporter ActP
MVSVTPAEREGAYGLAIFAATAFSLGMGLIAVLERIGAPDGLVQALGPLLALLELVVVGVLTRAPSLLDFLTARRSAPTLYGAFAFAATAAGIVLAMATAPGGAPALPWRGIVMGLAIAALIVAPGVRGARASAVADVLATGFPATPTRITFALVLAAAGLLTTIAGFDLAADTLMVALRSNRTIAEALVMIALALSIMPGGFRGLVWSDAACGGGALLIAAIGAGLAAAHTPAPFAPLETAVNAILAERVGGGGDSAIWRDVAVAAAIGFFFALTPPAIGARGAGHARRVGLAGLLCAGVGLASAGVALPYFAGLRDGPSKTAEGMIGAATWLPALALARAGVLGVSRAVGFDLATVYARLGVLSSRRVALSRLTMLATIVVCPAAALRVLDSGHALFLALAISLAFVTPSLLLTLIPRAGARAVTIALGAALVISAARFSFVHPAPEGPDLLVGALIVGTMSLVVGVAFALIVPDPGRRSPPPIVDPFVDIPLDGID